MRNGAKVRVCWKRDLPAAVWHESIMHFGRVPLIGEFIELDSPTPQCWFKVRLVVHVPDHSDWAATLWAVEADMLNVEQEMLQDAAHVFASPQSVRGLG